jgi:tetratricopeptide (TPR) repeat protein
MHEDQSALLQDLALFAADRAAVDTRIADATAMRPEALQQLEQALGTAWRAGELPEPAARTLLAQVRGHIEATRLRPAASPAAAPAPAPAADAPAATLQLTPTVAEAAAAFIPVEMGPGTVLKDRFVLKREIGRGGMGTVHAADDRRKLEAEDPEPMVAVKVLQPALAKHPAAFMALQRESRRAQELAHPNIATVFDLDRDGDLVFMTMELLRGEPLDAVIRGNDGMGLERRKAMAIVLGIAQGLAYAHRKGLVHADLKPSNVFLTDEGQPRVLDFGIARAIPGGVRAGKDKFDAGEFGAYTEAYATAEMVEGNDPNPADDIYALGLIAYELLTGRHPYQRLGATEAQRQGLKPRSISGLPRREWAVIERSLAFARAGRPADASAFLRDLTGLSGVQKSLIAATAALTLTAGYFGYARYEATGPDQPLAARPAQVQEAFREHMSLGDADWQLYVGGEPFEWQAALQSYAQAYEIHPRNREATSALRRLAKGVLSDHPEEARDFASLMAETSPYLANYGPVRKQLSGQ